MAVPAPYPLSVGSLSRLGWSIFRFAWARILLAAGAFLVPAFTVSTLISLVFDEARVDEWLSEWNRSIQDNLPAPAMPANFGIDLGADIAAAIFTFICSFLAAAAIVSVVDGIYRGQGASAGASVRLTLRRLPALVAGELLYVLAAVAILVIGLSFASVLVLGGGLLTFVAFVVFVGTFAALLFVLLRTAVLVQGVMVDGTGGAQAFGRSWRLVAGSGWRVFGYLIAITLLSTVASVVLGGIAGMLVVLGNDDAVSVIAATVLSGLVGVVLAPLAPIVLTLLYLDLRWQHGERVPLPGGGETAGRPGADPRSLPR